MAGTLSRRVTLSPEMIDRNRTLCVAGCFNGASMCGSGGHRQRVAREGCAECVLTNRYLEHSGRISRIVRTRWEEHTSELQSPDQILCRLLPDKKKNCTYPVQKTLK